ncbi:MAG: hypothetical protein CMI63_15740 [Parvularcula sp.]|nr:hypothetical protein [Parvularcula sp.]
MKGGLAALAGSGVISAGAAFAAEADSGQRLVRIAKRALEQHTAQIPFQDRVGLADFSAPSWRPRFHLVDMTSGKVSSFLVAHGRGSDPRHTGLLQKFSNRPGSNATSAGAYRTDAEYVGKYGRSMRLEGLDPENSNAYARAIVIHAAWYVGDEMIEKYGKLGRSEGCFAFCEDDRNEVLARLGEGRLLYAGKF